MTGSVNAAHRIPAANGDGFTPGFTLIELIITLTLGLTLAVMLVVTTGRMYTLSPMGLHDLDTQYELLLEMEDLTGEYRSRIEAGTLDLSSLMSGWTTSGAGVTLTYAQVAVADTGAAYTVGTDVYKVTMAEGDHSISAYFTE